MSMERAAAWQPPGSGLVYNIRTYGAVGDGVTDDTVAVAAAWNACTAGGGGIVFAPPGTYLLSQQGIVWGSNRYCVRPTASSSSVVFRGCGDSSVFTLALHQHAGSIWFMFALNKLTGSVVFEDLAFSVPAPVTPGVTPGQGPAAITVGEIGGSETGDLDSLIVQRCSFTNLSFFVHGQGCSTLTVRDCTGIAKGGGLYPTYFCEPYNLASDSTNPMDLLIERTTTINDAVYGDHTIYTLGTFQQIVIRENLWDGVNHDSVRIDGGGASGETTDAVIVENNTDTRDAYIPADGNGTSVFLLLSSPSSSPICRLLRVVGNTCKFAYQAVYSEWAFGTAIVEGNDFQSTYDIGLHFVKDAALSLQGMCRIGGNNFNGGNTSGGATNFIKAESFLQVAIYDNRLLGISGSRSISNSQQANQLTVCVGNKSNISPSWVVSDNPENLVDLGNSWNASHITVAAIPTVGTWKVGDVAWRLTPVAGGPVGWICTTAGTPGTWTEFGGASVVDSLFRVFGSSDSTKKFAVEADAQGTGLTTTLNVGAQTGSFSATLPVMPSSSIFAMSAAALTSGRIPFATTNGLLSDSSNLQWNGTNVVIGISNGLAFGTELFVGGGAATLATTGAAGITKATGGGVFPYDQSGSLILQSRISATTGRGSVFIATGSPGAFALYANESQTVVTTKGRGCGITSTATAAGTTTLTIASTEVQKFTGTTTQTIQFPAANLLGAGIGVRFVIDNHSTGIVTPTRAGSDTFKGGGTTYPVAGGATTVFVSDGVSVWGVE